MTKNPAVAGFPDAGGALHWTRRAMLKGVGVIAAGAAAGLPRSASGHSGAHGEALILLEAEALREGPMERWTNRGKLGGSFIAEDDSRPQVGMVDGRAAVIFDGKTWLQSSFPLPELLAGGKAFAVMLWLYTAKTQDHATVFTLGSRPQVCAEFNHGKGFGTGSAAFNGFGTAVLGHQDGPPPDGRWHHLAYVFNGGENGLLQLFLNGELSGEKPVTLATVAGAPLFIGSAFDMKNNRPHHPFTGAISSLRVLDYPLEAREVRNAIDKFTAFSPAPADGETVEEENVLLQWTVGRNGARSRLFMASSEEALDAAEPQPASRIRIDREAGECEFGPIPVAPGERIYWRIDHFFRGKTDHGDVWTFSRSTGPAGKPGAEDG